MSLVFRLRCSADPYDFKVVFETVDFAISHRTMQARPNERHVLDSAVGFPHHKKIVHGVFTIVDDWKILQPFLSLFLLTTLQLQFGPIPCRTLLILLTVKRRFPSFDSCCKYSLLVAEIRFLLELHRF